MTYFSEFPIFQANQVLTASNLNDLVNYLEQQDRLTRNALIGIGIVCGLEPCYDPERNIIILSGGVAVTSQGYLVKTQKCELTQFIPYTLPLPEREESQDDVQEKYPFFMRPDGGQIDLFELLEADHESSPGEPDPTAVSPDFLRDKVVLLYLECVDEELKNCDINDCSDKGAKRNFTLRKLLVNEEDAKNILEIERQLAGRPVHLHEHPKYDLKKLQLQKINPAANSVDNFYELMLRMFAAIGGLSPNLQAELKNSYAAYQPLLEDMYPTAAFPNGPFGEQSFWFNPLFDLASNLFSVQHFYDLFYDLVQAYNEFADKACEVVAECCPNPARFPKHLLLGSLLSTGKKKAEPPVFEIVDGRLIYDPASANTGLGPLEKPAVFRHFFIPSPLFDRQNERLQEMRSLHYRLYLLTSRYETENLFQLPIKITPSKDGDYYLSDKAIPFYYKFKPGDDLHRNWSFKKTIKNRLGSIFSYIFTQQANHPFLLKLEANNFYRIEGVVGKTLRAAMAELMVQKHQLGLNFGIEPVYMGLTLEQDDLARTLDQQARTRAQQAILKLMLCRMRDLDVVFLLLIGLLFYYLLYILALLSNKDVGKLGGFKMAAFGGGGRNPRDSHRPGTFTARPISPVTSVFQPVRPVSSIATTGVFTTNVVTASDLQPFRPIQPVFNAELSKGIFVNTRRDVIDRKVSDDLLEKARQTVYKKGFVVERVVDASNEEKQPIGMVYGAIAADQSNNNLYERTVEFMKDQQIDGDVKAAADKVYPTISLIDKSEDLMEVVSVNSVAEFDFQAFEARYNGFTTAYDNYRLQKLDQDETADPDIRASYQKVDKNYSTLAASGPQNALANLGRELQKRLKKIFGELQLEGFAKKNPGMEHKCGAPVGGTFVMLYTHRNFLARVLQENKEKVASNLKGTAQQYSSVASEKGKVAEAQAILATAQASKDPLDDFVVLADFCLPYKCCDSDCSDIDLQKPEREPLKPGTVTGTVYGRKVSGNNREKIDRLKEVNVVVVNLENNAPVEVANNNGVYGFTVPPGVYQVTTVADGFEREERVVSVYSDSQVSGDMILNVEKRDER
ncbi:MAG TPA: hypothetical protein ENJ95_01030 [Bacteroidetes bacterium]|nr:hypothetical protein [Bacteroidota bacterium]